MRSPLIVAVGAVIVAASTTPLQSQQLQINNNCVPTSYALVEREDGSFAVTTQSLLPDRYPKVPNVTSPADQTVVEGNLGMFLPPPGGARESYQEARFSWDFSASNLMLPIILRRPEGGQEPRIIYLGNTTHYDLCVYQSTPTDRQQKCGDPDVLARQRTASQEEGVWLERVGCEQNKVAPNSGSGLAAGTVGSYVQTGFKPDYYRGIPSIISLEWKLRACNADKCSNWSVARRLVWVPPPELIEGKTTASPETNPPWQLYFELSRVPTEDGHGTDLNPEVKARICVAASGVSCTAERRKVDGEIWVREIDVPTDGTRPTEFVDRNASNGNTSHYWFLNGRHNWTGATCWNRQIPDPSDPTKTVGEEPYCVYQENYESALFEPAAP